jgi:hypothetical protein
MTYFSGIVQLIGLGFLASAVPYLSLCLLYKFLCFAFFRLDSWFWNRHVKKTIGRGPK